MTCVIPTLFQDCAKACFSENRYADLKEVITTIALGALLAISLYCLRKIPILGFFILVLASYADAPSTICGAGFFVLYYASRFGNFCKDYYQAKGSIPPEYGLPMLILIAISWHCFNISPSQKIGCLRYQERN